MIEGCKHLKYEDRLTKTGLTTLEERRTRGDLIEVFKMVKGLNKSDYRKFFAIVKNSKTRRHKFKFVKNRTRLDIRKHFFSQRVVEEWNKLPNSVVESQSLNCFKNSYDKHMSSSKNSTIS